MTEVTRYLANMIANAYDPDFIATMDDFINADETVRKILETEYTNADYSYLRTYARVSRESAWYELCMD